MYFSSSMTIISATWRTTIPLTFARIGCDPSHKLPEEEKHIVLFTILLLQFLFNLHLFLINVCSYIWLKLNLKRKKKNSKKFHRNFIILLNISMRSLEKTLHSVELLNISMRSSIDIHIYIYIYIYICITKFNCCSGIFIYSLSMLPGKANICFSCQPETFNRCISIVDVIKRQKRAS